MQENKRWGEFELPLTINSTWWNMQISDIADKIDDVAPWATNRVNGNTATVYCNTTSNTPGYAYWLLIGI